MKREKAAQGTSISGHNRYPERKERRASREAQIFSTAPPICASQPRRTPPAARVGAGRPLPVKRDRRCTVDVELALGEGTGDRVLLLFGVSLAKLFPLFTCRTHATRTRAVRSKPHKELPRSIVLCAARLQGEYLASTARGRPSVGALYTRVGLLGPGVQ